MAERQPQATAPALSFFVTGGTMSPKAQSYVERAADTDIVRRLQKGDFCYILDTRQMGKSSLMARAAKKLKENGLAVAIVDLQKCGQTVTLEQWYDAQLTQIAEDLDLEDWMEAFTDGHAQKGPLDRWVLAIRNVLRCIGEKQLVIFIDEIDFVRSLPFPTDEFFTAIRGFYNERALREELNRLTFCLLGVAVPTDLIRDEAKTPFNLGTRIELSDFSQEETIWGFSPGLGRAPAEAREILKRVWYWTGGHPYLTQKLAEGVADQHSGVSEVDRICESLFLAPGAREQNDNIRFVANRMLAPDVDQAGVLTLFRQVFRNKMIIDDGTNTLAGVLRLSGIVKADSGCLKVRNQIYRRVFDEAWIQRNMPGQEVERQRAASRKARVQTASVALVVILLVTTLVTLPDLYFEKRQKSEIENANRQLRLDKDHLAGLTKKEQALVQRERSLAALEKEARQLAVRQAKDLEVAADEAKLAAASALSAKNHELELEHKAQQNEARATAEEMRAKDALNDAKAANIELQKATLRLTEQRNYLSVLRMSARADLLRNSSPDLIEQTLLLGIESIGKAQTPENYPSLLQTLALTPEIQEENAWPVPIPEKAVSSQDGSALAGNPGGSPDRFCVWRLAALLNRCLEMPDAGASLIVSDGGNSVWAAAKNSVQIWNTNNHAWVKLRVPGDQRFSILSPDGKFFATADDKQSVGVYALSAPNTAFERFPGKKSQTSDGPTIYPLGFDARGTYLALYDKASGQRRIHHITKPEETSFRDRGNDVKERIQLPKEVDHSAPSPLSISPAGNGIFLPESGHIVPGLSHADTRSKSPAAPQVAPTRLCPRCSLFSPDGQFFAAANEGFASLWQWQPNSRSWKEFQISQSDDTTAFAFSPESDFFATISQRHSLVRVFDTQTVQELARISQAGVQWAAFREDGSIIVSSPTFHRALYSFGTRGELGLDVAGHNEVAFAQGGIYYFSRGAKPSIQFVDKQSFADNPNAKLGRTDNRVDEYRAPIFPRGTGNLTRISADAQYLAVGTRDGSVGFFKGSHWIPNTTRYPSVEALAITSEKGYVAIASEQTVGIWPFKGSASVRPLNFPARVTAVEFDPAARYVTTGLASGELHIRPLDGGEPEKVLGLGNKPVKGLAVSSDGRWLSAWDSAHVQVWSWGEWQAAPPFDCPDCNGRFSPVGNQFVSWSTTGSAMLWSAADRLATPKQLKESAYDFRWDPSGRHLLARTDGGILILDAATWRPVGVIPSSSRVTSFDVSPDGKQLAIISSDGRLEVTAWKPADLIKEACSRLPATHRSLTKAEQEKYVLEEGEAYEDYCGHLDKVNGLARAW